MFKRVLALAALTLVATAFASVRTADAGIFYRRVAPVRRVVARAALPPYPVARRVAFGPPYYRYRVARPVYRAPAYYGRGVSIVVGY